MQLDATHSSCNYNNQNPWLLCEKKKSDPIRNKMDQKAYVETCVQVKRTREINTVKSQVKGWRGGLDKGLTLGRYVPDKQIRGNPSKINNWKYEQELTSEIASFYGKMFCNLAPTLFKQIMSEVMETQVPTLAEIEFDILHSKNTAFGSNLTYNMKDFSNCFHKDNDFNSYSFGIWAPISFEIGKLAKKEKGFECKGGQFLLGSYKVCIDFNPCDGIVEIIWRGKSDFHCTVKSTTNLMYTRIGTSVQINNSLVQRMKILLEMYRNGININKRVRGVNQIVEEKLKKLK